VLLVTTGLGAHAASIARNLLRPNLTVTDPELVASLAVGCGLGGVSGGIMSREDVAVVEGWWLRELLAKCLSNQHVIGAFKEKGADIDVQNGFG
jgi:hypothetical protein